jgi:arylsulfatase A-like enzyme
MFENAKRYDEYLEDVEIPEPDNLFSPPAGSEASKGMGSGVGRTHAPWNLARKLGVPDLPNDRDYAKAGYQTYLKRYLRCVKGVDDNIQRLIDYLKETGELDNTIIIYTSDQGVFLGEHDLMDKRWMYEESSRMPFIVYAPKRLQSGAINDWLINNADFAPTILELAGIQKTPDDMQGRSFADALVGGAKPADWRTSLYYRYWMHLAHSLAVPAHFGLRDERYKLIFFYGCDLEGENRTPAAWEFYDLEKDPHEMQNEYSNPEYAEIIAGMKRDLKRTRDELQETDEKYPAIQAIIDAHWHK